MVINLKNIDKKEIIVDGEFNTFVYLNKPEASIKNKNETDSGFSVIATRFTTITQNQKILGSFNENGLRFCMEDDKFLYYFKENEYEYHFKNLIKIEK